MLQTAIGAMAVAAVVAGFVLIRPAPPTTIESAAPIATEQPTATTGPATTTTTLVPSLTFPTQPVDDANAEGKLYGWGTSQPHQMTATVHWGGTDTIISRERRQLLADQLVQARDAAMAIGTVAEAERQGFVKNFQRINGRGYEYVNWSRFTDKLDLSKPTVLAFEDDKPDSRVMSVAYNVLGTIEDGPPTDLPLEVIPWHYHSNLCEKDNTIVGSVEYDADGVPYQRQIDRCVELGAKFRPELNHWMVDLWVIPGWENPWGLVSSKHPDMMFEPTPWFDDAPVEGDHEVGLFCQLGGGDEAAAGSTPS